MNKKKTIVATVAAGAMALTSLMAAPATADSHLGNNSLASYLTSSTPAFDKNLGDYDIVTALVNEVIAARALTSTPTSVSVLADGTTPLLALLPTDRAFRKLIKETTGVLVKTEAGIFNAVWSLGVDRVEQILLYHVVLGSTVDKATALAWPAGTQLTTAEGSLITVRVGQALILRDESVKNLNPKVFLNRMDLNAGNVQTAFAINRVLLPLP